jgi:hypothetical protein
VGKTDGTDKASRELTSRAPYQSDAQNLYLADILPQKREYIHPSASSGRIVNGLCPPCTSGPALKWMLAPGSRQTKRSYIV